MYIALYTHLYEGVWLERCTAGVVIDRHHQHVIVGDGTLRKGDTSTQVTAQQDADGQIDQ